MQWLRWSDLRRRVGQRDIRIRRFRERQVDQNDGVNAFLALELRGTGFLALISETSAFLFMVEPLILAVFQTASWKTSKYINLWHK